jgi:hypothetical protein
MSATQSIRWVAEHCRRVCALARDFSPRPVDGPGAIDPHSAGERADRAEPLTTPLAPDPHQLLLRVEAVASHSHQLHSSDPGTPPSGRPGFPGLRCRSGLLRRLRFAHPSTPWCGSRTGGRHARRSEDLAPCMPIAHRFAEGSVFDFARPGPHAALGGPVPATCGSSGVAVKASSLRSSSPSPLPSPPPRGEGEAGGGRGGGTPAVRPLNARGLSPRPRPTRPESVFLPSPSLPWRHSFPVKANRGLCLSPRASPRRRADGLCFDDIL